jgi:hypothetical protein
VRTRDDDPNHPFKKYSRKTSRQICTYMWFYLHNIAHTLKYINQSWPSKYDPLLDVAPRKYSSEKFYAGVNKLKKLGLNGKSADMAMNRLINARALDPYISNHTQDVMVEIMHEICEKSGKPTTYWVANFNK